MDLCFLLLLFLVDFKFVDFFFFFFFLCSDVIRRYGSRFKEVSRRIIEAFVPEASINEAF